MSGFCVFGLTRSLARTLAKQAVDRSPPPETGWTARAYAEAIEAKELAILRRNYSRQISAEYSSPFRCKEFIDFASSRGELISGVIMHRGYVDSPTKKGKQVLKWLRYHSL